MIMNKKSKENEEKLKKEITSFQIKHENELDEISNKFKIK